MYLPREGLHGIALRVCVTNLKMELKNAIKLLEFQDFLNYT